MSRRIAASFSMSAYILHGSMARLVCWMWSRWCVGGGLGGVRDMWNTCFATYSDMDIFEIFEVSLC